MSTLIMWSLLLVIALPYLVYPLLLLVRSRFFADPVVKSPIAPEVDLVICAYNEAGVIGKRLKNALALDYPRERLTIWVASDGSADDTVSIARSFAPAGVRCLDLPRGGKAAALNTVVAEGRAPVVAFSDANSLWQADALRRLVEPFADARVGGVAGDQRYAKEYSGAHGERGYWSFDRLLKRWQSRAGSVISATGAIYAVRRELFEPTPPDATDDFMVSTAVVARGKRLVFEEAAVALESPASNAGEYRRKIRILTRGLRAVYYRRELLRPSRSGFYALQLLLHKLWRRMAWIPLLLLIISAPWYAGDGVVQAVVALGLVGTLCLGLSGLAFPALRKLKPVDIACYLLLVNTACAVASYNAFRGRRVSHWSPTGASAGSAP